MVGLLDYIKEPAQYTPLLSSQHQIIDLVWWCTQSFFCCKIETAL